MLLSQLAQIYHRSGSRALKSWFHILLYAWIIVGIWDRVVLLLSEMIQNVETGQTFITIAE